MKGDSMSEEKNNKSNQGTGSESVNEGTFEESHFMGSQRVMNIGPASDEPTTPAPSNTKKEK